MIVNLSATRGEVTGHVRATDGSPLSNALVEIRELGRYAALAKALTEAKGEYTLNAPEGSYDIKVSRVSFVEVSRRITVQASAPLRQDFALRADRVIGGAEPRFNVATPPLRAIPPARTAQISGLITDAKTGAAVSGATVSVQGQKSIATGRDGKYALLNLAPGVYRINLSRSGFSDQERIVTVHAGEAVIAHFRLSARPAIFKR